MPEVARCDRCGEPVSTGSVDNLCSRCREKILQEPPVHISSVVAAVLEDLQKKSSVKPQK